MEKLKKSKYALKDSDYELLNSLFLEYPWIHLESKTNNTLEDSIKYSGKYVIYDSKEKVKEFAEKLEPRIGGVIDAIKYSTAPVKVTPRAPEGLYALIVYCNKKTRTEAMRILESIGVEYFEWKSTRDTWREILSDRLLCLNLYLNNPSGLKRVCELVGKEEVFEFMETIVKFGSEYAAKFKALVQLIESGQITNLEEMKAFLE